MKRRQRSDSKQTDCRLSRLQPAYAFCITLLKYSMHAEPDSRSQGAKGAEGFEAQRQRYHFAPVELSKLIHRVRMGSTKRGSVSFCGKRFEYALNVFKKSCLGFLILKNSMSLAL